jgi:uncharacterized membrane protein YozB (DUF420 family)
VADACHGPAHPFVAGADDLRQTASLIRAAHKLYEDKLKFVISQPALNASLNGLSAILLAGGYAAIRAGKKDVHKAFMVSAVAVSMLFLISYVTYHIRVGKVVLFHGQGWIRPVYFTILISHTILAVVIVPMILITLRRAWLERFDKHRLIARWTLPLWFYVCVTGVIVYLMVYQIYAPHGG